MAQPVPVASPLKVDQADDRTLTVYTSKQALAAPCGARRESEGGISETSTNATARTIGRGHPIARDRPQARSKGSLEICLKHRTPKLTKLAWGSPYCELCSRDTRLVRRSLGGALHGRARTVYCATCHAANVSAGRALGPAMNRTFAALDASRSSAL